MRRWIIAVLMAPLCSAAATYPVKPIRLIVPWPPGGLTDVITRAVADQMRQQLGQNIIVDNRSGATGKIGSELAARAQPDGYTIVVANGASHAISMAIDKNLAYDAIRDFEPIVMLADIPGVMAVHPAVPVHSVPDLIALAKAKPGGIRYATAGVGSGGHLLGLRLASLGKVDLVHVPYRGEGPAITDAIGGQVQMIIASNLKPQLDAGQLRAIATLGKKRFFQLPDLPTLLELGYSNVWLITWAGLLAPARTSPAIIGQLNQAANAALATSRVRNILRDNGYTAIGGPASVQRDYIRSEIVRYRKVIADFKLKLD